MGGLKAYLPTLSSTLRSKDLSSQGLGWVLFRIDASLTLVWKLLPLMSHQASQDWQFLPYSCVKSGTFSPSWHAHHFRTPWNCTHPKYTFLPTKIIQNTGRQSEPANHAPVFLPSVSHLFSDRKGAKRNRERDCFGDALDIPKSPWVKAAPWELKLKNLDQGFETHTEYMYKMGTFLLRYNIRIWLLLKKNQVKMNQA